MRKLLRYVILGLSAAAVFSAASCSEYLGNIDEGLNINNLSGKILIPKAVLGSNSLGVVYIGIFSGVDNRLGYLAPMSAPAEVGGGNTFPYGGTSVGDFYTRDARFVCAKVGDRTVIDAGTNFEVDFQILQFPFYKGSAVWAFADNDNSTCNNGGGFYDQFAIYVDATTVTPGTNNFAVVINPTDLSDFGTPGDKNFFLDAANRLYKVTLINKAANTLTVTDFYNYGVAPSATGNFAAQLIKNPAKGVYYGTQYQDVLNNPYPKYLTTGDLIPATPTTINDLSNVTLTLDAKVP